MSWSVELVPIYNSCTFYLSIQDELKELDDKYNEFADKEKELSKDMIEYCIITYCTLHERIKAMPRIVLSMQYLLAA